MSMANGRTHAGYSWLHGSLSRPAAFVSAACSLTFVFAAAGTPIPLYNTYRAEDAITNADLAIVSVGYFVAAATSLLVLGRLSNHVGRRPMALAALASAALSSLVLMVTHGVLALFIARALQGIACGVASSGLGSYVIETAPERPRWLPAAITGSAPMVGIPIGAITCGALVEYGPAPRVLIYAAMATVLVVCALLTLMSPETRMPRRGAAASLRPRLQVPVHCRRLMLATGAAFVATWSLGGFYQAFAPSLAAEHLGTANALTAAAMFASVMVLNPVGGPLSGRLRATTSLQSGMALFIAALLGIVLSLHAGTLLPFIAASLVVGLAQGLASTGAIRALLARAQPGERAGVLSTLYLIGYSAAAVPAMIARELTGTMNLFEIALGYAALGFFAAIVAILALRQPPGAVLNS
jgi:MFS family permease